MDGSVYLKIPLATDPMFPKVNRPGFRGGATSCVGGAMGQPTNLPLKLMRRFTCGLQRPDASLDDPFSPDLLPKPERQQECEERSEDFASH